MKSVMPFFVVLFCLFSVLAAPAAERLVSNFTFAVAPGEQTGELRVVARGDVANGISTLELSLADGALQVQGIRNALLDKDYVAVHDRVFADLSGEYRRTPWALDAAGGLWLPYFGKDDAGSWLRPLGLAQFQGGAFAVNVLSSDSLLFSDSLNADPLSQAVGALVPAGASLWVAQGAGGLLRWNPLADTGSRWLLEPGQSRLVDAGSVDSVLFKVHAPVFGVAAEPGSDALWLSSAKGLWRRAGDGSLTRTGLPALDTGRITGVWSGGNPAQIWVESSRYSNSASQGELWRSLDSGRTFQTVFPAYDSLNVTVEAVAFVGSEAWLAVISTEGSLSGLLRVGKAGPLAWTDTLPENARSDASSWVWGVDAGVTDRDVYVTSVCSFTLAAGVTGLAVSTYGGGVSVSADSGRTWKPVLNQVAVKGDLAEIRMVPSVLRFEPRSTLVAYQLSQASKVTIEIFSYDMKKVRTLVRDAARSSDPVRSSDPRADVWDGKDDAGRPVALGTYYVKVQDNHGHVGWGKVMSLGGRR